MEKQSKPKGQGFYVPHKLKKDSQSNAWKLEKNLYQTTNQKV